MKKQLRIMVLAALLLISGAAVHTACAQSQESSEREFTPQEKELILTLRSALQASTHGPADVKLIDEAHLKLPEGYQFVPAAQGKAYMNLLGNRSGSELVGLIMPEENPLLWFITIDFIKSGYIKDDDARNWKPSALLESLKEGTEEGNKDRIARGITPIDVVGWIEEPRYDSSSHHLVWSMLVRDRGSPADAMQTVNYNTYALGRDGYFQLNLVTSDKAVAADKKHASTMVSALKYDTGKTYADFAEGTDRVAEYGLAALVAGVAAKKVGLLAIVGVFLAKGSKLVLLAGLVFLGKIKSFFAGLLGKRKNDQSVPSNDISPPSSSN